MGRLKYVFLLSGYISNYKVRMFFCIVIHSLYKMMPICLGFETAFIISTAFSGNLYNPEQHFFIVFVMIISTALLNYLDILISHDVAYKILTELRNLSYEKIAQISPAGLEDEKSGNIMSIVLEDIEILEWFYAHSIIQIFVAIILPALALVIMGYFSGYISILLLLFIILMVSIPYISRKKSDHQGIKIQSKLGALNAIIIDGIQGIKDIVTFQWQKEYFRRMYKSNDDYNLSFYEYSKRSSSEVATINFLIGISSVASTLIIIYFSHIGKYSSQWILPLISLSTLIYAPLQETLSMSSNYGRIFGAANRVFDFLQTQPIVRNDGKMKCDCVADAVKNKIFFDNVFFSYEDKASGKKNDILKGMSFEINEGETVVLVGSSGCGKTTCSKLLQRFWDVEKGGIYINNINIKDIDLSELRKLITVIPQDVYIFNRSIKDNLKLANRNSSDDDIIAALKNANATDFVDNLKYGIETVVGERGMRLSGGEKQRLSIAQAFLKDSLILIMDEVTSNLDYNNENIINQSLEKLKRNKITLMIAHRLSTIKAADRIVYIKDGICAAEGSFYELMENNEDFRTLIGDVSNS
ncbi:ABC transporter ATP-binding protein [Peptostreptococcus sp. D1]|uniref:ABC transporter ATP-binding protein n=1 Tax=Peptostreptococcus sp. D1 TaxID=72304 RepID=UPI0008E74AE8|nr:ABC transporter ATP-binding protein [Peptostreptococcus sp. D1]SFE22595.1 ABC-type multidrug transport system, ATPase and permease component [Peptostreptococcus sp. D1]